MFSVACNLQNMDAYANDSKKIFQAKNPCGCNLARSNPIAASVNALNHFIFNKLKIYQKEMSKLPPYFIFQKNIGKSTSKLCQFSIHQKKGTSKQCGIFALKNYVEGIHRNDFDFPPIEIMSNEARRKEVEFSFIKITSKRFFETTWKFVDIFFSK